MVGMSGLIAPLILAILLLGTRGHWNKLENTRHWWMTIDKEKTIKSLVVVECIFWFGYGTRTPSAAMRKFVEKGTLNILFGR
jgi:hypothetical protein